ncbi:MAG: DUF3887 domain-containing protein [Phascolarctobacterium sp.]|nr:DUF3887 domain-containing protein [Phascolarctobacterium sp.]
MKKSILMLMMLFMLAFASVCSAAASNGKILDAEEAVVNKFLNASNFSAVSGLLEGNMKKDVTAEVYSNFKDQVSKNFGRLDDMTLRVVEKQNKNDVLVYLAKFEKIPEAEYIFVFELKGDKPFLVDFVLRLPQKEEEKK